MFEISFLAVELAFTVIWMLIRVAVWIKRKGIVWKREAVLLLLYIDLAVMIRFIFFPRELADGHIQPLVFEAAAAFPLRVNFVPLVHLFDYDNARDIIWNVVGNTALFIPTGIVLPVVYKKLDRCGKVVAAGALISLCIEILQLPFASRASDIDDLILNALGVIIGYGIYALIKQITRKIKIR